MFGSRLTRFGSFLVSFFGLLVVLIVINSMWLAFGSFVFWLVLDSFCFVVDRILTRFGLLLVRLFRLVGPSAKTQSILQYFKKSGSCRSGWC